MHSHITVNILILIGGGYRISLYLATVHSYCSHMWNTVPHLAKDTTTLYQGMSLRPRKTNHMFIVPFLVFSWVNELCNHHLITKYAYLSPFLLIIVQYTLLKNFTKQPSGHLKLNM